MLETRSRDLSARKIELPGGSGKKTRGLGAKTRKI
jgi:hypothetical protein